MRKDNCAGCMKALALADHKAKRTFCEPCRTEPCSGDFTRQQLTEAFRAIDTTTCEEDFISEIRLADGEWLDFNQFVTRFCR